MSMQSQATPLNLTVVTVCMNRQEHLVRTAPVLAAWPWHAEHLIIDWSSMQPLRRTDLPDDERIRLVRVEGESAWNPSRAYNFACSQASSRYLLRLDADCSPNPDFNPTGLLNNPERETSAAEACAWVGSGTEGRFGQFLLPAALFHDIGGFNEAMRGWGFEDKDLRNRLVANGCSLQPIPMDWIGVIPHAETLRMTKESASNDLMLHAHVLALKQAQMMANRLVAAHHPWSRLRQSTRYRRSDSGSWGAEALSIPEAEGSASREIQQMLRVTYWSRLLAIPDVILEQLPENWFPIPADSCKHISWSHRGYWLTLGLFSSAIPWLLRRCLGKRYRAQPVFVSAEPTAPSGSPPERLVTRGQP